jgi:isopenicillin N synthase-like dioxygenase
MSYGRTKALDTGIANLLECWRLSDSPDDVPEMCRDVSEVFGHANGIFRAAAEACLSAIESTIGIEGKLFDIAAWDDHALYGLYYPRQLLGQVVGATRQSLHCDSSLLTVMPRASHAGLQVDVGSVMIPLDLRPGDLLVLAGIVLERLTGGYIPACRHTVETPNSVNDGSDRYSSVFFVNAKDNTTLRSIAPKDVAGYVETSEVLAGDFMSGRFRRVYGSPE